VPEQAANSVGDATPPAPDIEPSGITQIAGAAWVIPDRRVPLVPNVGILVGEDAVLVVDSGMGPRNGKRVLEAAQGRRDGRRLVLTITHFHPEHGFGAQAFRGEAMIVYNRAQLDELHAKGLAYIDLFRTFGETVEAALEGVELVEPDDVYDGEKHEVDLGGLTVQLRTFGRAHTRGDQVVFLPDDRILFAGDLVESRIFPIYPYFPPEDTDVDGEAWIATLRRLEALEPSIVVPGHGEVGDAGLIATARAFHEDVRDRTYELADAGSDADEAVAQIEPLMLERHPDWDQPEWIGFAVRSFHARRRH
jgi:glyoxylase-like metal-dependent hydrolase (beta-lactamase superfamily II)